MKIFLTVMAVFLATLIADGILLPGLFHIYGSFLAFGFLAAMLVVYGNDSTILIFLFLTAFFFELWHGFYLFSMISAAVCGAALWQWLSQFFSIEPLIKHSRLYIFSFLPLLGIGYVIVAAMGIVFLAVEKYAYRTEVSWATLGLIAEHPSLWLTTGIGLAVCMVLLRLPGYQSMPSSGKFYI